MNIKYMNEEYTLISETSGISYVYLMFVKVYRAGGISLLTMNYRSLGNGGKLEQNWMHLPMNTLKDLAEIVKDHSRQVAL